MSSNVMSTGVMVPLECKITQEDCSQWNEILYEQDSTVRISYNGDIAYTEEHGAEYGISFGKMTVVDPSSFKDLEQFGIIIEEDKAMPYQCLWYNGGDSDMDMMTRDQFLIDTNQKG